MIRYPFKLCMRCQFAASKRLLRQKRLLCKRTALRHERADFTACEQASFQLHQLRQLRQNRRICLTLQKHPAALLLRVLFIFNIRVFLRGRKALKRRFKQRKCPNGKGQPDSLPVMCPIVQHFLSDLFQLCDRSSDTVIKQDACRREKCTAGITHKQLDLQFLFQLCHRFADGLT